MMATINAPAPRRGGLLIEEPLLGRVVVAPVTTPTSGSRGGTASSACRSLATKPTITVRPNEIAACVQTIGGQLSAAPVHDDLEREQAQGHQPQPAPQRPQRREDEGRPAEAFLDQEDVAIGSRVGRRTWTVKTRMARRTASRR